jgi:hypothetical protein
MEPAPTPFLAQLRDHLLRSGRMAVDFVKSVTSGDATDAVIAARTAQCGICPERIDEERGSFCGACGCPRTPVAELGVKLRFAYLRCPRGRPGFSETNA